MSCYSMSRALYRVFVAPNLPNRIPPAPRQTPALSHTVSLLTRTTVRPKSHNAKRQALSDYFTFDGAIKATKINYIDDKGAFIRNVSMDDVMRRINRVTQHLVQIQPGQVGESGDPDPNNPPTCKVMSKIDMRNQHNKKLEIERRQAKGQGTGPSPKTLELNWAIAGGDLKHRLEKLKGFLKEGRKVELMLGPKRKGRQATSEECAAVLKAVGDAVAECKGAGETKREGVPSGVMKFVFQGRKLE